MLISRFDTDCQQHATFQLQVNITDSNTNPIDLSQYSAIWTIKTDYSNSSITESMSTATGEIQIANAGTYILSMPANRTGNLYVDTIDNPTANPPSTIYVYDFIITSNTAISTKIMYGQFRVYASVSI